MDIIYTYTRKQAIEDGQQVLLEGDLAEVASQLYRWPVYLTRSVYELIEMAVNNEDHYNDWEGVIWDICWMSQRMRTFIDPQTVKFKVKITGTGQQQWHDLIVQVGPIDIDDPSPCITIMHPEEL